MKLIKTFLHPSITEDTQDRPEEIALILIGHEIAASLDWWIGSAGYTTAKITRKLCLFLACYLLRNTQGKNGVEPSFNFIKDFHAFFSCDIKVL